MEHCIAQLAEGMLWFQDREATKSQPAFESEPSGPIMTGQLKEMSHRSQLTNTDAARGGREDEQSKTCDQVKENTTCALILLS